MGLDFIIAISSLVAAVGLGLSLAAYNLKMLRETHDVRMAAYRKRKKLKNEALKRYLELHYPTRFREIQNSHLNTEQREESHPSA